MTVEMDLYIRLKRYLKLSGWQILGGQPPSGSDHLPVIEIKLEYGAKKGSKDALKPDLVALKDNTVMIFEIKPAFSEADHLKLLGFKSSSTRIESFWKELKERNIKDRNGQPIWELAEGLVLECALAYLYPGAALDQVWTFLGTDDGFEELPPSRV
jgi:hypothetical protein